MQHTFNLDTHDWFDEGPSRRLRKAYAQLAQVQAAIERVRRSNPVPDHAPSSCALISRQLAALTRQHQRLESRLVRLQTRENPWNSSEQQTD